VRRRFIKAKRRFDVLERDQFRCVYCGRSALDGICLSVAFHDDHAFPKSRGGSDGEDNLVACCADCNIGKGDRVLANLPPAFPEHVSEGFAHSSRPPMIKGSFLSNFEYCIVKQLLGSSDRDLVERTIEICSADGVMDTDHGIRVIQAVQRALGTPGWFPITDIRREMKNEDEDFLAELKEISDDSNYVLQGEEDCREFLHWLEVVQIPRRELQAESKRIFLELKTSRLDAETEAGLWERWVEIRRAIHGIEKKEEHYAQ
jgi:hypothetical protein